MTTNEVLECYNESIEDIREERQIIEDSHFVCSSTIKKHMGPIRECTTIIKLISPTSKKNQSFIECSATAKCKVEDEQAFISFTEKEALYEFFKRQHNSNTKEDIINGTYKE